MRNYSTTVRLVDRMHVRSKDVVEKSSSGFMLQRTLREERRNEELPADPKRIAPLVVLAWIEEGLYHRVSLFQKVCRV